MRVVDLVIETGEDVRERVRDVDAVGAADVLGADLLHEIEETLSVSGSSGNFCAALAG